MIRLTPLLFAFSLACQPDTAGEIAGFSRFLPRSEDRGSMWWRDGFPGIVEGARWHRCVETGHYRFVLDTEKLAIPHLGSAKIPFHELPKADLALEIVVDGKTYRYRGAEPWSRFVGPRLIESGKFLQRADVTGLRFADDTGKELNVEARFETVAWPDRLGLILAARPGVKPIQAGEASFGRVNGGFGLDGRKRFEVPANDCVLGETFTLEFWTYLPLDFRAGKHSPWLVCKNYHEAADGNVGLVLRDDGVADARLNIGGGAGNSHRIIAEPRHALKFEQWNHVALSYDGTTFRLYANGQFAGETAVGKKRIPKPGGMAFGGRQDDKDNGNFPFRGVVDEIRIYDRSLTLGQLRALQHNPKDGLPHLKPIKQWSFRSDVAASMTKLSESWKAASIGMRLANAQGELKARWDLPAGQSWERPGWQQAALMLDPVTLRGVGPENAVAVEAAEAATGNSCPVVYEPSAGWNRINLDGVTPVPPAGAQNPSNDAIERVKLILKNPTEQEQVARLMFEKTKFLQRIGTPITGVSAILRDASGSPTGIPVQLSKNWHHHPQDGGVHSGQWFHGISQVRLPPKAEVELELTLAYGHWGGVAAASHAQLSLIGWGGNQRWDESALGAWGESICYDPEQAQAGCAITDVRPLMVRSMKEDKEWGWTRNVGGGDFFRLFDRAGKRLSHTRMKADYRRYGPCLTEVNYHGGIHRTAIRHSETVSLARSDDLVCSTYRIRMDVGEPVDFSRFVILQVGSDRYNPTRERKMAVGDAGRMIKEWKTQWGGGVYRGEPVEVTGRLPWASLHEAVPNDQSGALANRGLIIREWKAVLGGKEAKPWFAERGVGTREHNQSSILDVVPPPGVTRLEAGDYVEATIQHIIVPQSAADYYGPNMAHRVSLEEAGNTWHPVLRQVIGDDVRVEMKTGRLQHLFPDVRVAAEGDKAGFSLTNGIGYVPVTFTGLTSHQGYRLTIDGRPLNQGVHGNDFWQTDYDPATGRWSHTYNIIAAYQKTQQIRFERVPNPDQP